MQFIKKIKENKVLLLMALPILIWEILFKYLPMFGTLIAFKNFNYADGFWGSKWVGFKNFEFLFKSADAFIITRNTVLYSTVFLVGGMILAVGLAVIYDILGGTRINKINQSVMLFPHFISWIVASYFVAALLDTDRGLLNQLIKSLGGKAVDWYNSPRYWVFILPIVNFWKIVGYNSIIYYSTIKGFNAEYYEAARIDGASWFQQVRYITVPLLKSIAILMFILNVGSIFYSDFGLFYMVPRNSGSLYGVTSTIDTYVYNGLMGGGNLGMTTATGLYQSIVGFTLVMITNKIVKMLDSESAMF